MDQIVTIHDANYSLRIKWHSKHFPNYMSRMLLSTESHRYLNTPVMMPLSVIGDRSYWHFQSKATTVLINIMYTSNEARGSRHILNIFQASHSESPLRSLNLDLLVNEANNNKTRIVQFYYETSPCHCCFVPNLGFNMIEEYCIVLPEAKLHIRF